MCYYNIILEIVKSLTLLNDPSTIVNEVKLGRSIILNVLYVDNTRNREFSSSTK